jgi:hypothetical protein
MPDSSPSPSRDFQIYLSSTLDDLVDERRSAIEILRRHGRVIDSYRADPRPTVENCLADVRSSQLYVLILGRRYGWVPAGESDTHGKSITEMEYDECTVNADSPIPRLVFIRTTTPDRFNDDVAHPQTAERMRRFRERATTEQQSYHFDSVGQFSVALTEPVMIARAAWESEALASQPLSESEAYHLLSDADACATFEGAKVLLDRLTASHFTDPDLVTCIVFSKNLVEFCLLAGVPRDASDRVSSFWAMMREVNLPALIRHVSREGLLKTLGTAFQIRRQINQYPDVMWRLSQKYGPGEVAGRLPG